MKFKLKTVIILLSLIFSLQTQVLAGDAIGLRASCTIPAIPGVNAPLNEGSNVRPEELLEEKETPAPSEPQETEEEKEKTIFIEELSETQLAEDNTAALTKVIYSR